MKTSIGPRTILYPTPVLIVGTYDAEGRPNIMNAAWGGICCSQPPCVAISVRRQRHTHDAILKRNGFTVSLPSAAQVREADYAGIYSGADEDKFAALGLTAKKSVLIDAPYVEEFPIVLECRLLHTIELGTHTQFIGEILDVKIEEQVLEENRTPDIRKVDPIMFSPTDQSYYRVGDLVAKAFTVGRKP